MMSHFNMKQCFKCNIYKELDKFYKHKRMKDGHLNKCIECAKSDVRIDRRNSNNARIYDMKRYYSDPNRKKIGTENTKRWRTENPLGYAAHLKVKNAIDSGWLTRKPCEICGEKADAHHDDYSKPFDIKWLCALHHHRLHAPTKMKDDYDK